MKIRALIYGCVIFFSTAAFAAEKISAIRICVADGMSKRISEEQVRNVLPLHEGDIFLPQKLDEAIDFLHKWGVFSAIAATPTTVSSGVELEFYLEPAILIGEIDVIGNYPYVEQKIRKHLSIRPGDLYTHDRIEEQIKRIKDFYEKEGFFNTIVTASEEWDDENLDVKIAFKIKRGTVLRYKDIIVNGAKKYPAGRIVSAIYPLKRYRPRMLSNAVRGAEDFYRRHGFPRARVKILKKEFDFENNKVNLTIDVNEGQHVAVDFEGNRGLSKNRLRKALTFYKDGGFDEYEIEESVNALIALYHKNGFPSAKVTGARSVLEDQSVLIRFKIEEGLRHRIHGIDVTGNLKISDLIIKKQMKTKKVYDEEILKKDAEAIENYYKSEGFLKARVSPPEMVEKNGGIKITVPVLEDGLSIIRDIEFSGNVFVSSKDLLDELKNRIGRPFNPERLLEDRDAILTYYADRGYPYAEVEHNVEHSDSNVTIKYNIKEGALAKIGQVLVVGNSLTSTGAIRRAMSIQGGDKFSSEKILDSQFGLRRMGAFNSVTIDTIGLAEKEKVVHLRVKVEEQKPFMVDLQAGYSTGEDVVASMNFTNVNSFGLAKRTNLNLTGGRKISRAEGGFSNPRFFGTDFELSTSTWFQYEDKYVFTYLQTGGGFGFFRKFHRTGLMAKYDLTRNYFMDGSSTAADTDSLRDNTISRVSLSASFDTRNSFSDPSRGIFTMVISDFYNEIRGNEANFAKLRWSFGAPIGFLKYFTLSQNFRFGRIQTLGSDISIPSNQLLLLGGDDTIRGFPENSLGPANAAGQATGGRISWAYNAELNIKVLRNWKLAGFYDMGSLTNAFDHIDLDSIRHSAGPGIRYITPVGPLRLDYGIILDANPGDDFGRLHFSFGYLF